MDSQATDSVDNAETRPRPHRMLALIISGGLVVCIGLLATAIINRRVDALPTSSRVDEFRIGLNAPFITTADAIVDKMVEVGEITADDVVFDLGCGDGRLVITAALKHGCHGVGIDIDPVRVAEARANVKLHGVEDLVEIREQDVFTVDLSEADVILMYLLPWMTKRLIPQFQEMASQSRIVSHDFGIGDILYIKPDSTHQVSLEGTNETHLIHRWDTPLHVPPPRTE